MMTAGLRNKALWTCFRIWQMLPGPIRNGFRAQRYQIKFYRKVFTPGENKPYLARVARGPNEE